MPTTTYKLTNSDAKSLMKTALEVARYHWVTGAIAIVDAGGNPMLLESLDDTMGSAGKIALGKAAMAVAFKRPTIDLERGIMKGSTPMLVLNGAASEVYVPLKGGYPILYKGELIGAIAVAGTMDADMDEVIALQALHNKEWCRKKEI